MGVITKKVQFPGRRWRWCRRAEPRFRLIIELTVRLAIVGP